MNGAICVIFSDCTKHHQTRNWMSIDTMGFCKRLETTRKKKKKERELSEITRPCCHVLWFLGPAVTGVPSISTSWEFGLLWGPDVIPLAQRPMKEHEVKAGSLELFQTDFQQNLPDPTFRIQSTLEQGERLPNYGKFSLFQNLKS